jgi:hypothetical protein
MSWANSYTIATPRPKAAEKRARRKIAARNHAAIIDIVDARLCELGRGSDQAAASSRRAVQMRSFNDDF